jgi:hypothetical protein
VIALATNYWVVWHDMRFPDDGVYGARVTFDGDVLDPITRRVRSQGAFEENPTAATDGNSIFVCWTEYQLDRRCIKAAFLDASWETRPSLPLVLSRSASEQTSPALAFNGSHFLLVWEDSRNLENEPDIYGARITLDGQILDPSGILIAGGPGRQIDPRVAASGTNFFVVWRFIAEARGSAGPIHGARIADNGIVLDPNPIVLTASSHTVGWFDVGGSHTNYLLAWDVAGNATAHLFARRIARDGSLLEAAGFSMSPENGRAPAIAYDGTNYFIAWQEVISLSGTAIKGSRLTPNGQILDANGILIGRPGSKGPPRIAFAGDRYLVAWRESTNLNDGGDLYGNIVRLDASVLNTNGFPLIVTPRYEFEFAIAGDQDHFWILWGGPTATNPNAGRFPVRAALLTHDGSVYREWAVNDDAIGPVRIATGLDGHSLLAMPGLRNGSYRILKHLITPRYPAPGIDSIDRRADSLWVNWHSHPGKRYQIQYREALGDSGWVDLGEPKTAASALQIRQLDSSVSVSQRFYQIVEMP